LAVRLEFVGALIIFLVALLAVLTLISNGVDAGLVGLVLTYALNATSSLVCFLSFESLGFEFYSQNWVVRAASEVEQNIVSVERILHQSQEKSEAPYEIPSLQPAALWPSTGIIEFKYVLLILSLNG
jgi:ABC-type multidrug transport system fused ATPase/permease subunit